MQTECITTSLLDCYAEVLLILCKDNYFIAVEVKKMTIIYPNLILQQRFG